MKKLALIFALTLLIGSVSCTPPYRQTFNDAGKQKGWTTKQTNAAFAYADRVFWSHQLGENKYVIAYGKIPTAKVREQLEGVLRDLDAGLDPKNEEMKQYLDTFKLRKDMGHDEEIAQAIYDRVRASELQTQFNQKMGDTPEEGPEAEAAQGYNIRKIYVNKSLADAFPFTSEQIEAAKKNGSLKQVGHVVLDESKKYDHKAPNPANPNDANDFVWKARQESIDLTEYKIVDVEKPQDNRGSYIEGFRIVDGKKESKPALKVFFPTDCAIALVDTDEEGTPGFGVPNVIQELGSDIDVVELARSGDLLTALFEKKEVKKSREAPETKLFKVEIAPLGVREEWTKSPDAEGWIVPLKYLNERGDNYNVRVHYKTPKFDPETHTHSEYMEIEYVEKEYIHSGSRFEASAGQVIEYYHPKAEFAGKVKAQVLSDDDTKKVQFEFEDGSVIEGFVTTKNKFIEDTPYAKSYNEGQKRWLIEKSEGSKVFDKRKAVGPPKEATGEYSDDDTDGAGAQAYRPGDGMEMGRKPRMK
jgi:hypothetical protein